MKMNLYRNNGLSDCNMLGSLQNQQRSNMSSFHLCLRMLTRIMEFANPLLIVYNLVTMGTLLNAKFWSILYSRFLD